MGNKQNFSPPKLYKYRSMSSPQGVLDIINNCEMPFSRPDWFNDIFDCRPVFECDLDITQLNQRIHEEGRFRSAHENSSIIDDRIKRYFSLDKNNPTTSNGIQIAQDEYFESIYKNSSVYSVSELNNNPLMWAHYADNHKGVCLEFNGDSGFMREARKVVYARERPVIKCLILQIK
jgi:hypothetical protein